MLSTPHHPSIFNAYFVQYGYAHSVLFHPGSVLPRWTVVWTERGWRAGYLVSDLTSTLPSRSKLKVNSKLNWSINLLDLLHSYILISSWVLIPKFCNQICAPCSLSGCNSMNRFTTPNNSNIFSESTRCTQGTCAYNQWVSWVLVQHSFGSVQSDPVYGFLFCVQLGSTVVTLFPAGLVWVLFLLQIEAIVGRIVLCVNFSAYMFDDDILSG